MDDATLVPMAIGIAVIVLIGGLGLVMFKSSESAAEDRLAGLLTGNRKRVAAKKQDLASGILARPSAIDLATAFFLDATGTQCRKPEPTL